jgi:hypothetical protein
MELVKLLTEPSHLARILKLMAVEEKKGAEEFSGATYSFIYVCFFMLPYSLLHLNTNVVFRVLLVVLAL